MMNDSEAIRKTVRHYNDAGHAHELTFSCYKRRAFLSRDRTRGYLADAIGKAKKKQLFDLWAYVVMPEHVHLLVWPSRETYSISAFLLSVKQSVSRRALIYLRRNNPSGLQALATGQKHTPYRFWMDGGGYDRNVTSTETLVQMVDYIHNNPVRRGLVAHSEEWAWSSARDWTEGRTGPIGIDRDSFPIA